MEKFESILIIDDDQINTFVFSKVISVTGVAEKTESATCGRSGLGFLKERIAAGENLPEIIFLDINMPVMDGWEFLEEYKKFPMEIKERISLYMLSSSVSHQDISRAKAFKEVIDYIPKPLTKDVLFQIHNCFFKMKL